ncbi:hypothetical protein TVAG_028520 [Trichomonas vaginalis G3]|uniref:Tubby C-terminal domain-containing protein n=1 Tax=Trichomonas vaginalis (strain ATCC PRA-98 / G3) TaxID=412133 RepID=A2E099_TRIV3|nr:tubby protein, chain A domain-containing protein [Trichomonas vaginalis G3]EAY13899.1 hypothetical protein TVAG_028520 [Trichomonas vaginalis G3]KAI5520917.1 tubby protein, chain A domain-containing protein [Trichomonas vaginalis G3]|eukprot:XP_001326122.1 hypothetical protein [Trichomonas vaginalis G3]
MSTDVHHVPIPQQKSRRSTIQLAQESSDSDNDPSDHIAVIQTVKDNRVLLSDDDISSSTYSSDQDEPQQNQISWAAPNSPEKNSNIKSTPSNTQDDTQEQRNVRKRRVIKRKVPSTTADEEEPKTETENAPRKRVKRVRKKVSYENEEKPTQEDHSESQFELDTEPEQSKPDNKAQEKKRESIDIQPKRRESHSTTENTTQLTPEERESIAKSPLDIKDSTSFQIKRNVKVFGHSVFSLIESDRILYYTKYEKIQLGKGFKIFKKNTGDGELIGFLRFHNMKKRFTFYLGKDEESLGEVFGLCYITSSDILSRIRQMRVCFQKSMKLNFPATKEQNLSRICMNYGKELEEKRKQKEKEKKKNPTQEGKKLEEEEDKNEAEKEIINYNDFIFSETMIPRVNKDGSLSLNFGGIVPKPSIKNFIIRKPNSNKVSIMVYRMSNEMFTVRYSDPWTLESAFGFALAALDGEG